MKYIINGDIIYLENKSEFKTYIDGYLVVEDSIIKGVFSSIPDCYSSYEIKDYKNHIIIPGLTDLHLHASQYQFRGLGSDKPLLEWLNTYAFKEECKFSDSNYAEKAYDIFIKHYIASPSTRCAIFATIDKNATLYLAKKMDEKNLIAYVGKVNMDRNSPAFLIEETATSIKDTEDYIKECLKLKNVKPIITPRFIPTCTDELCLSIAALAKKYDLRVQTHLSENDKEIELVKSLTPDSNTYLEAYKNRNLLIKDKTIMAHCVYSKDVEEDLLKDVYIAHSPDSNINICSGIAPAVYYLEKGYNIALGTDVAGGSSLSMFRAITDAIRSSKMYHMYIDNNVKSLNFKEAFYMASVIGGSFFGKVGTFCEGYDADIVVLPLDKDDSLLDLTLEERLEQYVYNKAELPIYKKFIKGIEID